MVRRNQKSSLTYWRSTTENVFKKTGNKISGSKDIDEFEKDSTLQLKYTNLEDVEALVFGLKWSQKYYYGEFDPGSG